MNNIYTYYMAVNSNEHMLFANEIAIKYNLYLNEKPRMQLIFSILKKYIKLNAPTYESLYYQTRYGLREVFPAAIYEPAMDEYMKTI